MMSRKDYRRAADIIQRTAMSPSERELVIALFIDFFVSDNPRFDPLVFGDACQPVPEVSRG